MIPETATDTKANYIRLLSYVKDRKIGLIVAIIGMIGYGAVDTLFVYSIKPLIDEGLSGKNPDIMTYMPIFILGIVLLRGICGFASSYGMSWVGGHLVMKIQRQIFNHLMLMPVSFFDKNPTGTLLSKITYDSNQVSTAATASLVNLVRESATIIGLLCLMFYNSWQLSLIFFVIGPPVGFAISLVSRRFRKISTHLQHAVGNVTTTSEQMLNGHREILSFGGQPKEEERFNSASNMIRRQQMKMATVSAIANPAVQFIASIGLSVVLFAASSPELVQELTPGTFTIIVTSMMMLLKPLRVITQLNNDVQRAMAACTSLFSVLDMDPENDKGTFETPRAKGKVVLKDVQFTYPTKNELVLKGINLTIEEGQTVALVGRSGSGKTTIASLLPKFYEVQQGSVLLDDRPIQDYKLANLREQFAQVSQTVHLFSGTIADNIGYAKEDASREDIERVAEMANVTSFVDKFEDGFDTIIGEKGVMLSGGQRQRIAIARALLKDSPVLILDEATSALDTESERKIQEAIDRVCSDRTAIVIAHRLSTIESADVIVVLDEGVIVEQGSHAELMAHKGTYHQLHQIQFGEK
ncbi:MULTISPECIES: lipid A export permease/ATP-binding protein MsbA [unclassified Agarivorans]|uniref:lipid A export permease/ATP-binding protein MsbA n=1 Tax=unclassified Agarivorans TaxID=2636026 RepID=UPI0026E1ABF2|nr:MULTISPECIES: lipid A export permease/ATP-binding protein MsbA [unclassified Agarivorans]MDO6686395.1 lipid A export permease/ATP-binding protein MsbA [Agarivorans sp. 3_MG-2023]MDO6713697.1 lipid A export permease/ATP-binding protein MsbA [Agarivorans sp. 2_MG-2023]